MKRFRHLIAAAVSLIGVSAWAQDGTGLRPDIEPGFGLRAGLDARGPRAYDALGTLGVATTSVESGLLLADWRPLASGFRLTGGLAYNNPGLEAFGVAARSAWAPVVDSSAVAGSSSLRSPFGRTSPYLGLGWGVAPTARSGLYFSADVGLMYQRGIGPCSIAMPPMLCMQLQNDLRYEDDARLSPVLTMGVGLRF